jgi:Carboxyl transferase domain
MYKSSLRSSLSPLLKKCASGSNRSRSIAAASTMHYISWTPSVSWSSLENSTPCMPNKRSMSTTAKLFQVDHDPSEIKKKFRTMLAEEREQAKLGGGMNRIQKQHKRGSLTARERLELLYDNGTFNELDQLKAHRCTEFQMDEKKFPGDGIGMFIVSSIHESTTRYDSSSCFSSFLCCPFALLAGGLNVDSDGVR